MKSVAAAIIIALATVHSFTPNPTFGSRRASLVDTQFSSFSTQLYGFKSSKSSQYLDSLDQEQMMAEQMNDVTSPLAMDSVEEEEEMTESQKLLKKVKESGTAGIISYALWELGFWALSVPVCIFGYREVTGHFPDLSDKEDLAKLGGEAFAFVNFARFAVPLRIGLALSTTPWIDENIVKKFFKKDENNQQYYGDDQQYYDDNQY